MSAEAGARRAETTRPFIADLLILGAMWGVAIAVIDPRGDFPLNDDWAYAIAVQRLVSEGVFHPPAWVDATLLTQALWGALIAAIAGFSHTALRASTLLLGGAAVLGTYLLARQLRVARAVALFAALVLAANPLFVVLSHSFMTDVPMLAMVLYALLFFAHALESDSLFAWGSATCLTIAATLCRQPAIVPALGFFATVVLRPTQRRRWLILAALSVLLAVGALWTFQTAMQAAGTLPSGYVTHATVLDLYSGPRSALLFILRNAGAAILYSGLFLMPLLVIWAPGWRAARRSWWRWGGAVEIAALAQAVLVLWWAGRRMPLRPNVLIESGLGPITLNDCYVRHLANDPRLPSLFWWVVTAVSAVGGALLFAQGAAAAARLLRERSLATAPTVPARTLLLATGVLYLAMTCLVMQYDRYLLPLVPILGLALQPPPAGGSTPARRTWIAATLPLLMLAAYAVTGTHDYLAWNRARWQALRQLAGEGIAAQRIDGGFEFNAPLFHMQPSSNVRPGHSWWWVADDEYVLAMGPVPEYEVADRVFYPRWLPPGTGTIAVLHRVTH